MRVAVVGAGIMGSGIAQIAAMAGHDVRAYDVDQASLDRAGGAVMHSLDRLVRSDKLSAEDRESALGRMRFTVDLREAVDQVDVAIEAAPEMLSLKQELLSQVIADAPQSALLGTNTSQLSITAIGAALGDDAGRLVGTHFFNPPVMMRLVELICGLQTTPETLKSAREFATSLGKEVVVCRKDSPGFITSRAYAILRLECLRMVEEGLAGVEDIDTALRLAFNFPMGPFELGDFNGLDTYLHAICGLEAAHGERFRPTVGLRAMVAAGRLGRKTGHGFYRYAPDGTVLGPGM